MILVYHKAYILILLVDSAVKLAFSVYKLQIFFPFYNSSGLLFWLYFIYLWCLIREFNVTLSWADANIMLNKEWVA